jgi:hypothetical protein
LSKNKISKEVTIMKLSKKMLVLPVMGVLTAGALVGAQHIAALSNSPPGSTQPSTATTAEAPEPSTEAPETPGTPEAPGGHEDPAGTNVDHQFEGVE